VMEADAFHWVLAAMIAALLLAVFFLPRRP
jgi:hypothetical protein